MSAGLDFEPVMARAICLASRGGGATSPNPMVGCVLIDAEGNTLGEGYHRGAGQPHAEVEALEAARADGRDTAGSIAVVSLEPCATHGRTPPCVDALASAGVASVVFAIRDPGDGAGGAAALRARGIETIEGVLEDEARVLNEMWLHAVRTGRPFFHVKSAQTLNGRVTLGRDGTRWISGEASRRIVHRLRRQSPVVLTGIGTVLEDDPRLTVREWPGDPLDEEPGWPEIQPIRVVLDSKLRLPPGSQLAATARDSAVWVFCDRFVEEERRRALEAVGVDVVPLGSSPEGLDLGAVAAELMRRGAVGVLVEAGPALVTSFLRSGLVDRWTMFLASEWTASKSALPLLLSDAPGTDFRLTDIRWDVYDRDVAVSGLVEPVRR